MTSRTPIESLLDPMSGYLVCPECKQKNTLVPLKAGTQSIDANCSNCRYRVPLVVPRTKKLVLYLDQWFISELVRAPSSDSKQLLQLIDKALSMQLVTVLVSTLNIQETAAGQLSEKVRAAYIEFYRLANGFIVGTKSDPVDQQHIRAARGLEKKYCWTDCFDVDPNCWQLSGDVRVISYGLLNLEKCLTQPHDVRNQQIMDLQDHLLSDISLDSSKDEIHSFVKEQYLAELRDAAMFHSKQSTGETPTDHELGAFNIHLSRISSDSHAELASFFCGCEFDDIGFKLRLSAAFDAVRLDRANVGRRCSGDYARGKSFNAKYGVSALNDTSHVARYAPYVDFLLVDTATSKLIRTDSLLSEVLSEVNCTFIDQNSLNTLNKVLSDLARAEWTLGHKLTARLCQKGL